MYTPSNPPKAVADVIYLHRFDVKDPLGHAIPAGTDLAATYCWSYPVVTGGTSIELKALLEPASAIDWTLPRAQENPGVIARYGQGFGFPEAVETRVLLSTGAVVVNDVATPTAEDDDRGNEVGEALPAVPASVIQAMGLPAGYTLKPTDTEDLFFCRDFTNLYLKPLISRFVVGGAPVAIPTQPTTPPVTTKPAAPVTANPVVVIAAPAKPVSAPATTVSIPAIQTAAPAAAAPAASTKPASTGSLVASSLETALAGAIGTLLGGGTPAAAAAAAGAIPTVDQLVERLAESRLAALPNGQGPAWFTGWVAAMKTNPVERGLLAVAVSLLGSAAVVK